MLRLSRSPWRDGYWVIPGPPGPVRFRSLSLSERIRAIPAHSTGIQLQFVSWWLFLVLYFVARLLLALYMTCFGFSVTKGVPLSLFPVHVTSSAMESLAAGNPLMDDRGKVLIDTAGDRIHIIDIGADGSLELNGDRLSREDLRHELWLLHPPEGAPNTFIAVRPQPGVTYQQVVAVLDDIAEYKSPEPDLGSKIVIVSAD